MSAEEATSLELLEEMDVEVRDLAAQIVATRGQSVEERAEHGNLAKTFIRRIAVREAAMVDVVRAVESVAGSEDLEPVLERTRARDHQRRALMDRVERLSRGVPAISLNTGRDFESELDTLLEREVVEVEWELGEMIPLIRRTLDRQGQTAPFHSARHVERHAPTNLSPAGPKWHERAPVVSRLRTVYDHLRDFPGAAKR